MSEFDNMSYPVGRKAYRCEWCGQSILTGEKHVHYVGKWDGEFQNWRMHLECYNESSKDRDALDGFTPFENERPVLLARDIRAAEAWLIQHGKRL